ncbi:uncharacterized protein LOC133885223 [Phragmites australis]|uniref:uncharacterized protein LOC133885223 n=1 Tax=Phragmites australis TaxID=29695 RepID=UPI002D788E2B|nr:uncharacterized protein LOC133885223 [Phragmites australis]
MDGHPILFLRAPTHFVERLADAVRPPSSAAACFSQLNWRATVWCGVVWQRHSARRVELAGGLDETEEIAKHLGAALCLHAPPPLRGPLHYRPLGRSDPKPRSRTALITTAAHGGFSYYYSAAGLATDVDSNSIYPPAIAASEE